MVLNLVHKLFPLSLGCGPVYVTALLFLAYLYSLHLLSAERMVPVEGCLVSLLARVTRSSRCTRGVLSVKVTNLSDCSRGLKCIPWGRILNSYPTLWLISPFAQEANAQLIASCFPQVHVYTRIPISASTYIRFQWVVCLLFRVLFKSFCPRNFHKLQVSAEPRATYLFLLLMSAVWVLEVHVIPIPKRLQVHLTLNFIIGQNIKKLNTNNKTK